MDKENLHKNHRARLRERYKREGLFSMEEHIAIELLLTYAIPRVDTNPIAHRLMLKFGSLYDVITAPKEELMTVEGIGESAATYLVMLSEMMSLAYTEALAKYPLDTESRLGMYCAMKLFPAKVETVGALYLDSDMMLIDFEVIAKYDSFDAVDYCAAVLRGARRCRSKAYVLCHNHIDAPTLPSGADIGLNAKIRKYTEEKGVQMLGHVIVSDFKFGVFDSKLRK